MMKRRGIVVQGRPNDRGRFSSATVSAVFIHEPPQPARVHEALFQKSISRYEETKLIRAANSLSKFRSEFKSRSTKARICAACWANPLHAALIGRVLLRLDTMQRRILVRWEYHAQNFLGFVQLARLIAPPRDCGCTRFVT